MLHITYNKKLGIIYPLHTHREREKEEREEREPEREREKEREREREREGGREREREQESWIKIQLYEGLSFVKAFTILKNTHIA